MPITQVNTGQIFDGGVQRTDINTTVSGKAVIAKAVQGASIKLTSTGADAGTGDVTIAIDPTTNLALTAAQSIIITDSEAGGSSTPALTIGHNTTSTPATGLGPAIEFQAETSTTQNVQAGRISTGWSNVTQGSQAAYMDFSLANSGALANKMRLFANGGLGVNNTTDPGAGVINANTGYKVAGASATLGNILTGDGAQHVSKGRGSGVLSTAVNTAGTVSTVAAGVHAGLAGSVTPQGTGRILIIASGYMQNSLAATITGVPNIRYGTGTAPTHGAAATGTVGLGSGAVGTSSTANYFLPFTIFSIVTGLTVGTTYWLDVCYLSGSATGTAKLFVANIGAIEF